MNIIPPFAGAWRRVAVGLALGFTLSLAAAPVLTPADPLAWPAPNRECRPWAYNWWMGSAVDTNNLARELRRYAEAGLGGIHVIPIYGAKGAEARYLDYLSPRWMEMLEFAVREAGRLGLGVDMTTGTGWCFGGPAVPKEQAGWRLQTRVVPVARGGRFTERIARASVVALVAQLDGGRLVDLKDQVPAAGSINWTPPDTGARVHIVTAAPGGPNVKRAAPGGAGPMINPFDRQAMLSHLAPFTAAFEHYPGPLPRSMYHDSFEYNSSWSPDLLEEFERRRGYRLQDQVVAFCADPKTSDQAARVRCDFQETLSDLLVEKVFPEWTRWCAARGIRTRHQAHGAPANLLDFYALADMPETEMFGRGGRDPLRSGFDGQFGEGDRDPLISKFASSAAHAAGRRRVCSETGTWMAEHFCETLEELKCLVDLLLSSGVNHALYHGCAYSPDDAAWPGWLFYASTEMNPRNAIWRDAPALNAYVTRCQSVLQDGQPDADVALYWPIHEFWQGNAAYVSGLTVHRHDWLTRQPLGRSARALWQRGFGFDYVSDRLLASARVDETGRVAFPGAAYAVVAVPPARLLPLPTLEKLLALAEAGGTVIFEGALPQDVPGAGRLEQRRAAFQAALQRLGPGELKDEVRVTRLGRGRVLVGPLEPALAAAGVKRERLADHPGALVLRRRHEAGRHYFVVNQGTNLMRGWFPLATPARSAVVLDALSGRTGLAALRQAPSGEAEIQLRLEPGHSILVRTFQQLGVSGPAWHWLEPGPAAAALPGPWRVEFIAGGPVLPKRWESAALSSWTANGDPETERFGGTAVYRTEFEAPAGTGPWCLDLGRVCHSATVRLNGRPQGTLIMAPYRLELAGLAPGRNLLEVEITNLSANRIRDLDRRKVPWRVFHEINLVNINYKPFDASNWRVMDSGLLGPVTLRHASP